MATTYPGSVSKNTSYFGCYLKVSESDVNNSSNTSLVTAELHITRNNWGWETGNSYGGSIEIDGTPFSFSYSPNWPYASSGDIAIATKSKTVPHNTDGSKSCNVSATWGTSGTYSCGTAKASGTLELTKIPRYATSVQSLSSKTETSISINWSSNATVDYIWYSKDDGATWTAVGSVNGTSGSFTIPNLEANTEYNIKTRVRRKDSQLTTDSSKLPVTTYQYPYVSNIESSELVIGNTQIISIYNPLGREIEIYMQKDDLEGTILYSEKTNKNSLEITPDKDKLYETIPNSQNGNAIYYAKYLEEIVSTKSGTYSIDKYNCYPIFNDFEYADTDINVTTLTGNNQIGVNTLSDMAVSITAENKAEGKNSATISKYRITIGNTIKEVAHSDTTTIAATFNNISSSIITVAAIDSRGLETSISKTIEWKDYIKPSVISTRVLRENGVGTKVLFEIDGNLWNKNFGNAENQIHSVFFAYKEKGAADYSNWIEITNQITYDSETGKYRHVVDAFLPNGNEGTTALEFTLGIEYEVQFYIQDSAYTSVTTSSDIAILNSGIPCTAKVKRDDGKYSIGVNKLPDEKYAIDVDGNVRVTEDVDIEGNTKILKDANIEGNANVNGVLKIKGQEVLRYKVIDTW